MTGYKTGFENTSSKAKQFILRVRVDPSDGWQGASFSISIDGESSFKVKDGQEKCVKVESGQHFITVKGKDYPILFDRNIDIHLKKGSSGFSEKYDVLIMDVKPKK